MSESGGSNGGVHDLTPQILREIRDELRGLRGDTKTGFLEVNTRIDRLGESLLLRVDALEARVTKLER
jgi:hypothetical protein